MRGGGTEGEPTAASSAADLRRVVTDAADRIHVIIDAAERSAEEIRAEAEAEAAEYLAERRLEADRVAEERIRDADPLVAERAGRLAALIRTLSESAQQLRLQADETLGQLDRVVAEVRAGIDTDERPPGRDPGPPIPVTPTVDEREPELPKLLRPRVAAIRPELGEELPEVEAAAEPVDRVSEAVLRVTQMAVVGKERKEISETLRADFPGLDTDAIVDEILD